MPTAASTFERARLLRALATVACVIGGLVSCGEDGAGGSDGAVRRGAWQLGGAVVSTINGHPIHIADVEALVRASSLSPREALERLQAEQLLMIEAERRGISSAEIDDVALRARVQALLDREAAANVATEDELRAAYEQDARFHVPEQRASVHVLAPVGLDAPDAQVRAAHAVAKKGVAGLRTLSVPDVLGHFQGAIDGVTVKSEQLSLVPRSAAVAKEYLDAMFSLPEPGVVPEPVRTRFGWHAIRVTEVAAARTISYEEALTVLKGELSTKKQADAVNALLLDLRHANPVTIVPDANDKLSLVDGAETFRSR